MPLVLRITPMGQGPRGSWTNVWDVLSQQADYTDAVEAVDYIANAYKDHWALMARNSYSINGFNVQGLGSGLPTVTIVPTVGTIFGGNATSQVLPAQVGMLLRFSSISQRPNRARKYLPGFTEDGWDGDNWVSGHITNGQNMANEFIAMVDETLAALEFGVARVPTGGGTILFTRMTIAGVDPYPVIQRRRR